MTKHSNDSCRQLDRKLLSKLAEKKKNLGFYDAEAKYVFSKTHQVQPQVVVIDDDGDFNSYIKKVLCQRLDIDVYVFDDEIRALRFLSENPISLLIIDVQLEKFNGFEFGQSVRILLKEEIPIIYISSKAAYEMDVLNLDQRKVEFMKKPLQVPDLTDHVKHIIDKMVI